MEAWNCLIVFCFQRVLEHVTEQTVSWVIAIYRCKVCIRKRHWGKILYFFVYRVLTVLFKKDEDSFFQRFRPAPFRKNRRHPSAWLPAVFCLTDGNCQWLWCPIKALITNGAFKIQFISVDFWASNMESSHPVAFPLGSTDSHATALPCFLWSGCWTPTHTSAQSSFCHSHALCLMLKSCNPLQFIESLNCLGFKEPLKVT